MSNKVCTKYLPTLTRQMKITSSTYRRITSNSEHYQFIFQCSFTKEEKHCTFFGQFVSRDVNETSKFPGEERKNTLKRIT